MNRRHNFQTFSWFYDLYTRELLDLDPPYQRRSVWNQNFKDYFIETVLLNYPSPAIFLFEDIGEDGMSHYHVVDGKQRLTTLFEFVGNRFPVNEKSVITSIQGRYFSTLSSEEKKEIWGYQFLVEYIPTAEEAIINGIFDRINRNVAKLSPQELRHAKYDGEFITEVENLTQWMVTTLPNEFPRIARQSRRQMKVVELVALLVLLMEVGPRSYSQIELDESFSSRDEDWEHKDLLVLRFKRNIETMLAIIDADNQPEALINSRLRNQADFYSFFGAIDFTLESDARIDYRRANAALLDFVGRVEDENERKDDRTLAEYYAAARSASSDLTPRKTRIRILAEVLTNSPSEDLGSLAGFIAP